MQQEGQLGQIVRKFDTKDTRAQNRICTFRNSTAQSFTCLWSDLSFALYGPLDPRWQWITKYIWR